jgi:hypothetical protein
MIFLLYFLNILKNLENFIKIGSPGDCMDFRETPGKIGRVGMSARVSFSKTMQSIRRTMDGKVLQFIGDYHQSIDGHHQ